MKRTLIQSGFFMIAIIISIALTGCNDLSRSKAKRIALERINSNNHLKYLTINYTAERRGIHVSGSELEQAKLLEQAGYVSITYNSRDRYYYDFMNPLPKIEPFIYLEGYNARIIVATLKDINITGLTGSDNYKKVEYEINYSLTEVGQLLSYSERLSFKNNMDLTKYDDGWR
jgi:hypothetical protein